MLPDFLPSAFSEEDSVVQHVMGNNKAWPLEWPSFLFLVYFLKAQASKKKVIHIVNERVHILLIKSGKI